MAGCRDIPLNGELFQIKDPVGIRVIPETNHNALGVRRNEMADIGFEKTVRRSNRAIYNRTAKHNFRGKILR